jgi:hypothetical protein
MPALKTQAEEDLAQSIARGIKPADAYSATHPKASRKTCVEQGSRIAKRCNIIARVAELKKVVHDVENQAHAKAKEKAINRLTGRLLTMQDRRAIMGDIAYDDRFEPETRMRAVMNDAKLAGELIDKQDLTSDGEALPSAAPVINMSIPHSFVARRTGSN